MSVVLVGSNPGLVLFAPGDDKAAAPVAAASLWTVDWSVWGFGTVLIAVHDGQWRIVGQDEHLGRILWDRFTRHFPELAPFAAVADVRQVTAPVQLRADLGSGLQASGGGIEMRLSEVKQRRQYINPAFELGDITLAVSNVYAPCQSGELEIDGRRVPGEVHCGESGGQWSSSGYLAMAEVWRDPTDRLQLGDSVRSSIFAGADPRHLRALGSR